MGAAQGKKVDPAPLRLRRSRRSRPRARSSQREAVWLAPLRTASSGEDLPDIADPAQEAPGGTRRESNSGVEKGRWRPRPNPRAACLHQWFVSQAKKLCPDSRAFQHLGRCLVKTARTDPAGHSSYRNEAEAQLSVRAAVSNGCAELGGEGLAVPSGSAGSAIRPQAVPPTRIAPTMANASRQPCDGTPICIRPSVA